MQEIIQNSNRLSDQTITEFKRYLSDQIFWNSRLIEVLGARGVGKTTLLLQRVQELNKEKGNQALYISLDDTLMYNRSITEIAETMSQYGMKFLFLDEVHKYPPKFPGFDWSAELKNCYDKFPDLHLIYTGSSILKLYKGQGDLSRRKSSYRLSGLSFREYLKLYKDISFKPFTLDEIIQNHFEISKEIIKTIKILPLFKEYLKIGYFPFYREDPGSYYNRLNNIINVIIETDIPAITEITFETTLKIKKLLAAIASTVPYVPNLLKLRNELRITDHRTLLRYLDFLDKSELIHLINQEAKGNKVLQKPGKLFIGNPNLIFSLNLYKEETGTIRETFFASQLLSNYQLKIPAKGDFIVDDHYVFEIGGKNKTATQIVGIPDSFLVLDDIEMGFAEKIPLWLFGFLY